MKRQQIYDLEEKLKNTDQDLDCDREQAEEVKNQFGKMKNEFGDILQELLLIEKENKLLSEK